MSTHDLRFSDRFTLPGEAATISDIDHALAYLSTMTWIEERDGRQVFNHFDARHQQDLRYLVLRADDNRDDDAALRELVKANGCFGAWTPLRNGRQLHSLIQHHWRITPNVYSDNRSVLGEWRITFPQEVGDLNRSLCAMTAPRVQVGEDYTGRDLFEVIGRGLLSFYGRYKDVYLYLDKKEKTWRHIALNRGQYNKLVRGQWEAFHRRFIWFPSLSPYAYALETFKFPQDAFDRKVKLAEKELVDRERWDKENLRDYLENYRYRDKDVFNEQRLPKGSLNEFL